MPWCGGTRLRAADRLVRPHRSSREICAHIARSEVCVHDARSCGGALGDHPLSLLAVSVTPVRFNLSHSLPLGLYRLHPLVRPLTPGILVVVDVPG
jgi:type IV secretory pathway protease TraF